MSQKIVEAYMKLRERIREYQKIMKSLKDEEKLLINEIRDYLNQREEFGIKIDDNTVITICTNEKKIIRNPKAYKAKLAEILTGRGIRDADVINEIMGAKVENVVQQQKLKIVKSR